MIYAIVAVIFFLIASYTDLKRREVPETLTIGLIGTGLFLHLLESLMKSDPGFIISSVYMAVLAFVFSYSLYRIGAWAGGDVKLFTGLGAILPYYGHFDYFPFLVFASTFIAALPFIAIYIGYFFIRVRKLREMIKPVLSKDFKRAIFSAAYVVASYEMVALSGLHLAFTIPLVYILYKIKRFSLPFIVIPLIFFYLSDTMAFLAYFASIAALSFLLFFGINSFKIARENILRTTVKTKDLEEGMIPAENIYIGKVKVADSRNADGLTAEEMRKLKKARKEIRVKLSIPFVPVILLGMILLMLLEKVIK
jgi:preflagellin peptidase FlaK